VLAIDTFFSSSAVQTRSFDIRRATPAFVKFGGDGQRKFGRPILDTGAAFGVGRDIIYLA